MSDTQSLGGGYGPSSANNATAPTPGGNYPAGTPLTLNSAGLAVAAQATAGVNPPPPVIGLPAGPLARTFPGPVQHSGSISLLETQWQQVLGTSSGGLTPGATYYVSPTIAGQLTPTMPVAFQSWAVQVGIAESTTSLFLQISAPQSTSNA